MSSRAPRFLIAGLCAIALTSCATQVVSEDTTTTAGPAATTTLPTGTPAELLPQLVTTLRAVAEAIIDETDQRALLSDAEALWSAAKPQIAATDPDAADEIEGLMDLARRAVERTRPADADKAAKFLGLVADHYLAE